MTRIVIEGVQTRASLMDALSLVLRVMNTDRAYEEPEQVFTLSEEPAGPVPEETRRDAVRMVDLSEAPWNQPRPLPYEPCPDRGRHERLTDCWLCWSDVMRGVLLEPEAVRLDVWSNDPPASPSS